MGLSSSQGVAKKTEDDKLAKKGNQVTKKGVMGKNGRKDGARQINHLAEGYPIAALIKET